MQKKTHKKHICEILGHIRIDNDIGKITIRIQDIGEIDNYNHTSLSQRPIFHFQRWLST
jgi:hypothetical protein